MTDIEFASHGSIVVLSGVSEYGKGWLEGRVVGEDTQYWGKDGIVVEPRYVDAIIEGARADGLEVEEV